jgi:hypothetical protein
MPAAPMSTAIGPATSPSVIPVHNGEEWLESVLDAVLQQAESRHSKSLPVETEAAIDSAEISGPLCSSGKTDRRRRSAPRRRGRAQRGIRRATRPIVCQIDQDVHSAARWITDPHVSARGCTHRSSAGVLRAAAGASVWVRVMGLDLLWRYRRMSTRDVNHVCTATRPTA